MNAAFLRSKHEAALDWEAYLATDADKADLVAYIRTVD